MAVFAAINFIPSGLDKVTNWKGNLQWFSGHFSKTFLARMTPMMLGIVTTMELGSGLSSVAGIVYFLVVGSTCVMFWAGALGAVAINALFFGQKISKDNAGAAALVPYFLLMVGLMVFANPYAPAT